jgi:hypothetical protein
VVTDAEHSMNGGFTNDSSASPYVVEIPNFVRTPQAPMPQQAIVVLPDKFSDLAMKVAR